MIRILFVHHRSELGGAPASLSYLIAQLDRARYEPHVYCPAGPAAELFQSVGAIVETGPVAAFTHIWASTYSGRRWLLFGRELALLPLHVVRFRRLLRRGRFDLVHLNDSPLLAAGWLAHAAGVPVIWHLRSALPQGGRDRRSRLVRRAIGRFGTTSIAINDNVADSFGVGSHVIPNTVDLERFRPVDAAAARAELGLPADRPVVSFFGFIYPSKGFREFIRAAALLRNAGTDASYVIVGGDVRGEAFFRTALGRALKLLGLARDHEAQAKRLVEELRVEDQVQFVPFTSDTDRYYGASDVVVAPSRGPELGRPVLEAAASGRPVVASGSIDGAGIVLPARTGYLVPRRSPAVLASVLDLLLRDGSLREALGASARTHAEESFDPVRNAERVAAVYEGVLARA